MITNITPREQVIRKEVEHLQKECAELRAELDRVTALAHGQHVELHNARLELTALRNQEPAITVKMCGHNPPRIVGTNGELPQGRVGFYLAAGAQPESEPVGTVDEGDDGLFVDLETPNGVAVKRGDKLYLAAQKPAYVPLTDEQIDQAITLTTSNRPFGWRCFARAIEKQVRGES